VTSNQVLFGIGLIMVLAVGSQVLASRLRIPALIILLPALGLVAVLVLVTRPLVAFLATARTDLTRSERQFIGWMAPRGIVAAATAATFGTQLTAQHVGGAAKILPVTFLVIVATAAVYGLTAVPVARRLGVTRPARSCPLLVGGEPWVIDLARALHSAGLPVFMWAGPQAQRDQISRAGIELAPGELLSSAVGEGAEVQGITTVLLLTGEDDFNALAGAVLADNSERRVYRLPPRQPSHDIGASIGRDTLFTADLTSEIVTDRYNCGARIVAQPADGGIPAELSLLFLIHPDGVLVPVTTSVQPQPQSGDTLILLASPATTGSQTG